MGLTTDRSDPGIQTIKSNGQQETYLVLSDEERAKGFVRPVRKSYTHVKCGTLTTMGTAIAETYARNPTFYSGTFCCGCGSHFNLIEPDPADPTNPEKNRRAFLWEDGSGVGT